MSRRMQAGELMGLIVHQLRPAATTTMASCSRCGRTSPGGRICADCLGDDLGKMIGNKGAAMRWLESVRRATQDEGTVLLYASKEDALRG